MLRAGSVAEATEHLPSKCKALNSNLSTRVRGRGEKKEQEKEGKGWHWWLTPVTLANWETKSRGLLLEASPGK
jgi:hypothetical protein